MNLQLTGKRILVTGASRGIGRAIAETLAQEGAKIAVCARGEEGLRDCVKAIEACGTEAYAEAFDVRDPNALQDFCQRAAKQWGGLDCVVSNVSTRPDAKGDERWRQAFEADLMQHVRLAEMTLPHLVEGREASLVFIASIASAMTQLLPEEVAYGAFKAGLVNFAGALAERYGSKGVRVNCVSPGPIYFEGGAWDMYKQHKPKLYEMVTRLSALGRLGAPSDVANAVAYLVSPVSAYVTGSNLRVDGGTLKATNF